MEQERGDRTFAYMRGRGLSYLEWPSLEGPASKVFFVCLFWFGFFGDFFSY